MKKQTFSQILIDQFDQQDWPMKDGKIQISPEHLKQSLLNLAQMIMWEDSKSLQKCKIKV